ncbi:MAG: hydrogenase maturation nickel metallochaperone HypA [Eggerthellaceae bacterium]|nr:hydrogenase maturation nickel metallochaperone HypA [Eggerthellaceae bacterium]
MHELGVVFHMVDLLEDIGRERNLSRIGKVVVDLGEVSGVVTELFGDAWLWASDKHDLLRGAELEIHEIEAATVCNACGHTYRTVDYGRICPNCGSPDTELLQGNELNIREIEAE